MCCSILCNSDIFKIDVESNFTKNINIGIPQVMVTYGTSLTAGGFWVEQIGGYFNEKYPGLVKIVNGGQGGMDSRWGLGNVRNRVISPKPDCVTIEFSVNDVMPPNLISKYDSKRNLNAIIDSIIIALPNCEIILMTMNPRSGDSILQKNLAEYYDVYRQVAKERHCILVDNNLEWVVLKNVDPCLFEQYIPDGVHPSATGCENIIFPTILKTLGFE
jgi:lysophospholipase L1-like esterase